MDISRRRALLQLLLVMWLGAVIALGGSLPLLELTVRGLCGR
jgi:hypothetical protein